MITALTLFPLLWMLSVSFMAPGEANAFPPPLLPDAPSVASYEQLFAREGMARYFMNSLLLAALATMLSLTFNTMAGYAFAKLRFRGRDRVFQALLAALVIPAQVAMIPLFLMLKGMGLVNTYAAVLLPAAAGVFGIFLVRQYALSVPDEMLEAARVDGAGEFTIFRRIVLPTLAPIMVTLATFTFLATWNDFMWPLIVLSDDRRYTLPVALAGLVGEHAQDVELMMAGAVITVLPVLVLFLMLQRYYVEGVTEGSVK